MYRLLFSIGSLFILQYVKSRKTTYVKQFLDVSIDRSLMKYCQAQKNSLREKSGISGKLFRIAIKIVLN